MKTSLYSFDLPTSLEVHVCVDQTEEEEAAVEG